MMLEMFNKVTIPKQPSIEERRKWEEIIEIASDAGQTLKDTREKGEQAFKELLELFPDDGMVYSQREPRRLYQKL